MSLNSQNIPQVSSSLRPLLSSFLSTENKMSVLMDRALTVFMFVLCSFPERPHPCGWHVQCETGVGVRPELLTKQHCTCAGRWLWVYVGSSVIHTHTHAHTVLYCNCITCHFHQINNAGCMVNQRELTEEGLEKNFATNTLGKEKFFNTHSNYIPEFL